MQDSGSLAVFKVTARDQGHYKGPSGAFVTYCNISLFFCCFFFFKKKLGYNGKAFMVGIANETLSGYFFIFHLDTYDICFR